MNYEEVLTPGLENELAKQKAKVNPPNIVWRGRLLVFDQSLSSTGWAVMTGDENGAYIWKTGVLKSTTDLRGHEKTLQRAVQLSEDLEGLVDEWGRFDAFVFETPPVGSKMARPESSLLSALVIRLAAKKRKIDVFMISRQKAAKRWTNNPNAPKRDVRNALMNFGYTPKEWGLVWNEHVADALSLGLYKMEGI